MNFEFSLEGIRCNPANRKEFGIIFDYQNGSQTLNITTIKLVGEDAKRVNSWLDQGRIFESMRLDVRLGTIIFNYTLQLSSPSAVFSFDEITCEIRQSKGIDFLNDSARQFRFEYLSAIGAITPSMYVKKNYTIGRYPRALEILIASLTIYSIIREIINAIRAVIDLTGAVVGGLTGIAEAIIQGVALIVYLVGLVAALITLAKQLIDLLFPFVYYHHAMKVKQQLEIAINKMQLQFSSSVLDKFPNFCIEPPKNTVGAKVGKSLNEPGFYDGYPADLIQDMQDMFYLETKVIDGTVFMEQWPFYQKLSDYVIPGVYIPEKRYNASEVKSNFLLRYQYDDTDLYSYDAWKGGQIHVVRQLIDVQDVSSVSLKGSEEITLNGRLPNVVTKQSDLEKIMISLWNAMTNLTDTVLGLINSIKDIIGKGGDEADSIPKIPKTGSIGSNQQDTHFTSVNMYFIAGENGNIDPRTSDLIGTGALYEFHKLKSPVPNDLLAAGNQWVEHPQITVPMTGNQLIKLRDNNYCTFDGYPTRLNKLEFNPHNSDSKLDFEINLSYTNNLEEVISYDGGKL